MPGLTVVRGRDALDTAAVDAALDSVCFFDTYERDRLCDDGEYLVASTAYPDYPIRRVETDEWLCVLEGELYDVPDEELSTVLPQIGRWARDSDDDALGEWLGERDGDFVALLLPKGGQAVVVTDAFGRLPVFRARIGGADVLSREPLFVRELARRSGAPLEADSLGVAQTLTFGYRLGRRTLFEAVDRLPPGARVPLGERATSVHTHDFGTKAHADRSIEENASRLARKFVTACRNRADRSGTSVVSLSGGLDSRAVAAGYHAADVPFVTATFENDSEREVRVAREVAASLGVEWNAYRVERRPENVARLFRLMQGTNPLSMGFVLEFLEAVAGEFESPTLVTGDGGDKVFPSLPPGRAFTDAEDLLSYVLSAESVLAPADAAAVAGIGVDELRESVRERLAGYPEDSLAERYTHFYIRERGLNWLNLGEDRNRHYCWSVSPFYALPFFSDAMNCPNDQKTRSRLYRRFVGELSESVLDVEYADFGASITSTEYALKRGVYEVLGRYPRVRDALVGLVSTPLSGSAGSDVAGELRSRVGSVGGVLDERELRRVLDEGGVDEGGYDLLTVVTLAEELSGEA